MANKQTLINEIETLPSNIIDDILRYVQTLKQKQPKSDTPLTDSLIGLLEGTGIKNADDIKNMRLGLWKPFLLIRT